VKEATKYTEADVEALNAELGKKSAEDIVRWAGENYGGDIKFANSFGAEDVVMMDIIARVSPQIRVFTLDTGRLNDETYEVMEATRFKYPDIPIEVMFPDAA
jgi:phosphoadenosine phosphosulfate reductase